MTFPKIACPGSTRADPLGPTLMPGKEIQSQVLSRWDAAVPRLYEGWHDGRVRPVRSGLEEEAVIRSVGAKSPLHWKPRHLPSLQPQQDRQAQSRHRIASEADKPTTPMDQDR